MREPVERAYFEDQGRVHHAKAAWGVAKGFTRISEERARELSVAKRRAAPPQPVRVQAPSGAHAQAFPGLSQDLQSLAQIVAQVADGQSALQRELGDLRQRLARAEQTATLHQMWVLADEALHDPSPTIARHGPIAAVLGMTPEQDGDAEAWREAITRFKESGR